MPSQHIITVRMCAIQVPISLTPKTEKRASLDRFHDVDLIGHDNTNNMPYQYPAMVGALHVFLCFPFLLFSPSHARDHLSLIRPWWLKGLKNVLCFQNWSLYQRLCYLDIFKFATEKKIIERWQEIRSNPPSEGPSHHPLESQGHWIQKNIHCLHTAW